MSKNFSAYSAARSLVLTLSLGLAMGGSMTAQAPTQAASAYYNTFSIDEILKTGPKTIFVSPNYQVTLQIVGASITGISLELSKQKNFSVSRAQNGTMLFLDTFVKAGGADLNLILDDEMVLPLRLQVVNKPSGVRVYKGLSGDALAAESASTQAAPQSARPKQPTAQAARPAGATARPAAVSVPPPTLLAAPAPRAGTTLAGKSLTVPAPKPLTVTPPKPAPKPAAAPTRAAPPAPRPVQSTATATVPAPRPAAPAAVATPAVTVPAVPSRALTTTGAPRSATTSRAVSQPTPPTARSAPAPTAAPRLDLTVQRDGADALLTYRLSGQPGMTVFADVRALRVTNGRAALQVETMQAPRSSLAPMTGMLRVKNAPRELTVTWNVRSTSAPYTFPFGRKVTVQ